MLARQHHSVCRQIYQQRVPVKVYSSTLRVHVSGQQIRILDALFISAINSSNMATLDPTIQKLLIILGILIISLITLYFISLLLFCIPWVQRQSLYAHNIHTAWWHNLDDPETFGFASRYRRWLKYFLVAYRVTGNQVTAFQVKTPDGGTLYVWHILPRALYAKHEKALLNEKLGKSNDFGATLAYKLLVEDSESRLIINCEYLIQNRKLVESR
jgi:hypothetical protein